VVNALKGAVAPRSAGNKQIKASMPKHTVLVGDGKVMIFFAEIVAT
jgi:hypothetical protein